jgi:protein TonB
MLAMIIWGVTTPSLQAEDAAAPKPRPINPRSWVTNKDYPKDARRRGQRGDTWFRLDVDEQGVTTACTVTTSSGSEILDKKACAIMITRSKFRPALDVSGRPVKSTFVSRVQWIR